MKTTKDPAAVALGSRKSPSKAKAARENGKKGGRPLGERSKQIRSLVENSGYTRAEAIALVDAGFGE